ncbi:MAG: LytTR family DNA-binding domain-containing protein [Lachnospiraceae bacterium]|nr:LytTR family DNA-binding domain-containing protein [Lachnospiraceae bacterium]
MVKIAICEDDKFYIEKEKQLIESFFEKKDINYALYLFKSGVELLKDYRINYDIIFLDISMDEMNGLEVANLLRKKGINACIVFLTACAEYSMEGYKVDAHRYLLKNAEDIEDALYECLSSALDKMQIRENRIDFDVQGGVLTISPSKIVYAESKAHRVVLYVLENTGYLKEYYMYDRLDHVQEKLESFGFMRIHQSYLINKEYMKSVCRYNTELIPGITLAVSKKYYKELEDYYIRMRGEF